MRHGHSYGYKRGCDLCRSETAQAKRELRARKRGLTPVPPLPAVRDDGSVNGSPGPCVVAVEADLAELGELRGYRALAAGAVAMARILDSDGCVTTQPAAAKQLASLLSTLHREAAPKRGRLAAVQQMAGDRA